MLVIYYFHTDPALDIDNFVKPLQDALKGVIVEDDSLVSDLIIRKRDLRRSFVIERVTPTLAEGLETQDDFLYVSVNETRPEEVPI